MTADSTAVPRRLKDRDGSVDDDTGVNEGQERSSRDKSECRDSSQARPVLSSW